MVVADTLFDEVIWLVDDQHPASWEEKGLLFVVLITSSSNLKIDLFCTGNDDKCQPIGLYIYTFIIHLLK